MRTDGDTSFADANVLSTGDTSNNTKRYQTIDFANGGDIRHDRRAGRLSRGFDDATKIFAVGHGRSPRNGMSPNSALAGIARDRIEKLFNEGKSEAEVVAARPLADLDAKWAATETVPRWPSRAWSTTRSSGRDGVGAHGLHHHRMRRRRRPSRHSCSSARARWGAPCWRAGCRSASPPAGSR